MPMLYYGVYWGLFSAHWQFHLRSYQSDVVTMKINLITYGRYQHITSRLCVTLRAPQI